MLLCLLVLTTPAFGEEPVSPSEFRQYAEGHTLYFNRDGEPFGSEPKEILPASDGMVAALPRRHRNVPSLRC